MSKIIYKFEPQEPEIIKVAAQARSSFKYFWRELYWDRRRIVSALGLAMIKLPFSSDPPPSEEGASPVEHMWVDQVEFDGVNLRGILVNDPNWLTELRSGDEVTAPFRMLEDWMFTIDHVVYGGYTVHLLRAQMGRVKRSEHDASWGLDFGNKGPRLEYSPKGRESFFSRIFRKKASTHRDHPLCEASLQSVKEYLEQNPNALTEVDEQGNNLLHRETLAGNMAIVDLLLKMGADKNVKTSNGHRPVDLANLMNWTDMVALLQD